MKLISRRRKRHTSSSLLGRLGHGERVAIFALACAVLAACDGAVGDPSAPAVTGAAGGAASPAGSGAVLPVAGTGATAGGGAPAAGSGAPTPSGSSALPARLRRLTNAEFDASVKTLLGIDSKLGQSFTPDTRQGGYTRNDAQRVDPVFVNQLNDAATKLARMATDRLKQLAPCAEAAGSDACGRTFIAKFGERAYRRPLAPREADALLAVYRVGREGSDHAAGVEAVAIATLQSPGFLYVTELGETPKAASTTLSQHEIASALAYLLTGAPPDDALLQAATAGQLTSADTRRTQAMRLLGTQAAEQQVIKMVQEWLGIDRITETAKDSNVYPQFASLRDAMKREADLFVSEVMWKSGGGDVSQLLAADWTPADDSLARMYLNLGSSDPITRTNGRVSLSGVRRRGILNQGAFLSVNAHATETAPVLRGVAVLRRAVCANLPSPTSLNLNVVPPIPDPQKTTRERFTLHSQDAACASCHKSIDAIGFTFEGLDGMGRERKTENNRPIDSKTMLASGYSFDGSYADSAALAERLAASPELTTCFARQLFRYAAARSDATALPAETQFEAAVASLPAASRGKFADVLLAFIASDAFIQRGTSL